MDTNEGTSVDLSITAELASFAATLSLLLMIAIPLLVVAMLVMTHRDDFNRRAARTETRAHFPAR